MTPILKIDVDGEEIRIEINAELPSELSQRSLLIYSAVVFDRVSAVAASSGQHVPDLLADAGDPSTDEYGFWGLDTIAKSSVQSVKGLTAQLVVHTFAGEPCWLGEVSPPSVPEQPSYTQSPVVKAGKHLEILGQFSKFSVESPKSKKVEFVGTTAVFRNISDEIVYVTYYTGTKKGSIAGHLGHVGLEMLYPGDVRSISMEVHRDELADRLGIKTITKEDASKLTLYPFLVVYSTRATQNYSLKQ